MKKMKRFVAGMLLASTVAGVALIATPTTAYAAPHHVSHCSDSGGSGVWIR